MPFDTCVICRYGLPITAYDLEGLKMLTLTFKVCPKHEQEAAVRIIELEKEAPKKYLLKTGKEIKNPPNYQDREPGSDDC